MDDPSYFIFGAMILFVVFIASVRIYAAWLTGQYRIKPLYGSAFSIERFNSFEWQYVYTCPSEKEAEKYIQGRLYNEEQERKFYENSRPRRVPPFKFIP